MAGLNDIHIGCSGWVYRHWKGRFYPADLPQRRWFACYAETFDTVEINASFYRLPLPATFDGWREKAPAGFRYALKVNRFITHSKRLLDCAEPLAQFVALARRLGSSLGPILHQLPPSLHRDDQRLVEYLALLSADLEHVVEFRHASWYDPAVLALLDRHGVGFVAHDLIGLVSPRRASGRTAYVRFHGTGGKYRGRYSGEQTRDWARWLLEQRSAGRSVWAYFNNDSGGDAIDDARALRDAIATIGTVAG
ncbi:DUF72 domain-containing protein [Sphingomonas ginkgonis]|uniref:DUF72 domain-containing protein n=1 Tax=Sphingomonas ginkgonis TaxID=2315330 RepID=A0A429VAD4_9SPHN|nr:DUF72 domain-containing protein [Sphingomonas ginkgonis]RST30941.1 DUF72 domain-containing protein [Sphingomonas ginkgonis]